MRTEVTCPVSREKMNDQYIYIFIYILIEKFTLVWDITERHIQKKAALNSTIPLAWPGNMMGNSATRLMVIIPVPETQK